MMPSATSKLDFVSPRADRIKAPLQFTSRPRAGDLVRVRSRDEILATLDERGCLDGMPFMPEMLAFCGKTLQVFKRAHKSCETTHYTNRKLERTVLLSVRCDGSAHGGCEASCAIFWNEAWLEPVKPDTAGSAGPPAGETAQVARASRCSVEQLLAATQQGFDAEKGPRYSCQATQFMEASQPLSPYDFRQYVEDFRSGNVSLSTLLRGATYRVSAFVIRRAAQLGGRLGWGNALARTLISAYDGAQKLLPHGVPYPRRVGSIPKGQATPLVEIGELKPGAWVRIRSYSELLATVNAENKNRGLSLDAEHVPYCGKEVAVRSLVNQIIDEHTGYMIRFKSPAIILDGVYCEGAHSDGRMFCPRSFFPYWRPVWLTPMSEQAAACPGQRRDSDAGSHPPPR